MSSLLMQREDCLHNKVQKFVAANKVVGMWLFDTPSCSRKCKIYIRNILTGSACFISIHDKKKKICKKINKSRLFSLMIDETTDVSVTEQLILYFRCR